MNGTSTGVTQAKTPLEQLKRCVFIDRIRIKSFFTDFDKLRTGCVTYTQFLSALNMAGLNRRLAPSVLFEVAQDFRTTRGNPPVEVVNYKDFCDEVDTVFTTAGLEKTPLEVVPPEPSALLDRTRYQYCSKVLEPEKEERLAELMPELRYQCKVKRIMVKPFFDDACNDKNSPKLVGHVTFQQFRQVINVKLGLKLWDSDVELLIEKYVDDYYGDMVNYVAFAMEVDPDIDEIVPYTLGNTGTALTA